MLVTLGRSLLVLLLLAMVVIGGALALLVNLDPEHYKSQIEAAVRQQTGRELKLSGPIEISWWPDLHVSARALTLGNMPGFKDPLMLEVRELEVAVKTLPLLLGHVTLETAKIHGLILSLTRDAAGITNWESLQQAPTTGEPHELHLLGALALGGIDITEAIIHWQDERNHNNVRLHGLKVHTGPLAFDQPVEFTLSTAIESSAPALVGEGSASGRLTFKAKAQRYLLQDFTSSVTLEGKALPGGKATLGFETGLDLDLATGTAQLTALKGEGLGLKLAGELALDHLMEEHPGGKAQLSLEARDLAVLFKAFDLPARNRLLALKNRAVDIHGAVAVDVEANRLSVTNFVARLPGANLEGELVASQLDSATPSLRAKLDGLVPDLPALILLANEMAGGDAHAAVGLNRLLNNSSLKELKLGLDLDTDVAAGRVSMPGLHATVLDSTLDAELKPLGGAAGQPAFSGSVKASGPNLPVLVALIEALRGEDAERLDQLVALSKSASPGFRLEASVDADLATDRVTLPATTVDLMGNEFSLTLQGTGFHDRKPRWRGELGGKGPDLPGLLDQLQQWRGLAPRSFEATPELDRSFTLATQFSLEPANATLEVSAFKASSLGLTAQGEIHAMDTRGSDGSLEGKLNLDAASPAPLFALLGHPALATGLANFKLDTRLTGSPAAIIVGPVSASAIWQGTAGKRTELSLETGAVEIYPARQSLQVKDINLHAPGLELGATLEASDWKTSPVWSGQVSLPTTNLRALVTSFDLALPAMADPQTLREVSLDAVFKGSPGSFSVSRLNALVDATHLNGEITIADFARPEVGFNLKVDELDLDRYLPPVSAERKGAVLVSPGAAVAGAATLPLAALRALKVAGKFKAGKLKASNLRLEDVLAELNGKEGQLKLDPLNADGYQGRYSGVATLDARSDLPQITLNTSLAKVSLEPLLTDLTGHRELAGSMNFEARLTAAGTTADALRESLAGQATFAIQNGVLRGIDAPGLLRAAGQFLTSKGKPKLPTGGTTPFKALTGTLEVRDNAVFNKDLRLDGNGFRVTGEGMLYDMQKRTLKYEARLAVDATTADEKGERFKIASLEIPIHCKGPLSATSCLPDPRHLLKEAAAPALRKEVKGVLKEALESKAGSKLKKLLQR